MSSLPSLLTSATATPSERNLPSITVFFQEMGEESSADLAADTRRTTIVSPSAAFLQL